MTSKYSSSPVDKTALFSRHNLPKGQLTLTPSDRYKDRNLFCSILGVPKTWPSNHWVHLVHNWRTGGSSLTALLSVNIHDSYLKVGHPFTRDGWPVDYSLAPLQITNADQLKQWISVQPTPGVLAGHTYAGMATALGIKEHDLWLTLREPAARLNSGLLRFHRKPLKSSHPDGGYVGDTQGHSFATSSEVESVIKSKLSHELNGMTRRIAGYSVLNSGSSVGNNLEKCLEIDDRPIDRHTFDLAMDHLKSSKWIYLTDQVIPSVLMLEHHYNLPPFIHPCSNLKHNPQWNGGGITRLNQSLLTKHRALFEHLNEWDVKLYAEAQRIFWNRWKKSEIPVDRLHARRLLQEKPLISPVQFTGTSKSISYSDIVAYAHKRVAAISDKNVRQIAFDELVNANFWNSNILKS